MGTNRPGVCLVGITLSNSHLSANFLIWCGNSQRYLEHSIKEESHERYLVHLQCLGNIKKIKYLDFQAMTFLWPPLVKTWNLTRSKEDSDTQSYGVPSGQGNYEIFPWDDQLPQQVQCTQCTPCSTSHCTHTPGCRL